MKTRDLIGDREYTSRRWRWCHNGAFALCGPGIRPGDRYRRLYVRPSDVWPRATDLTLCLDCYERLFGTGDR